MARVEKQWVTAAGLEAVVLVMDWDGIDRHRCGYVKAPTGLEGIGYSEQIPQIPQSLANSSTLGKKSPILLLTAGVDGDEENTVRRSLDIVIDVHGGITFSGQPHNDFPGWWFGFDCAHAGDARIKEDPCWPNFPDDVVRTLDYVTAECESMARQLMLVVA